MFRTAFSYPAKDVLNFFPMHMAKGMTVMQRMMTDVDLVIEVHDARIPFTGRNINFRDTITVRPHLLVLNKMDLADKRYFQRVESRLREKHELQHLIYTNSKNSQHKTVKKKLLPAALEVITASPRYHRDGCEEFNMMIIGVPNVGKSSLINALRTTHVKQRKGKAATTGAFAGLTKKVSNRILVSDHPPVYVFDSPGIMMPDLSHMEIAMKLAAVGCFNDHNVGQEIIADYVLYWLNKHNYFSYKEYFQLPEPSDDILNVLAHIAKMNNYIIKVKDVGGGGYLHRPNFPQAAYLFLKAFREGDLGHFNLDQDAFDNKQDEVTASTIS